MKIECTTDYKTILICAQRCSERANLALLNNGVKLIDDKYIKDKCRLWGIRSIIQTIDDKLLTLIDTPGKHVDLIFIGEIESMLDIVEWTLYKHSEMLTLLTDGGKEFDSELLRLKKIIVKYAELESVLIEESLAVDY